MRKFTDISSNIIYIETEALFSVLEVATSAACQRCSDILTDIHNMRTETEPRHIIFLRGEAMQAAADNLVKVLEMRDAIGVMRDDPRETKLVMRTGRGVRPDLDSAKQEASDGKI